MKVLNKYVKSKDITNLDSVSQKDYLEALVLQQQKLATPDDYDNPYTFEQWYTRNVGVVAGQEKEQYEIYLKGWYSSRYTSTDFTDNVKQNYINFLKQITLLIQQEDDVPTWINDINWDDPIEIQNAIPYFAKKLKEIAIYLVNKRESIKKAKLKYNMTGANQALERLFREYLLKAFTQRQYVLNVPEQAMFEQFPQLSAVKDGFQIQLIELYDDTSYLDKDPRISSLEYYSNTNNAEVTAYYDSKGLPTSAYEWAFSTGFAQLCSNNPILWIMSSAVNLPLSAYDEENGVLLDYLKFELTKKYMGEDYYYLTGGYYTPWSDKYDYNFTTGNNWFYYPTGEYIEEANIKVLDPIALSATSLIDDGANGNELYFKADRIFIQAGDVVSGAWLKRQVTTSMTSEMSAQLLMGKNTFRFPYPGYGVSGEDLPWTGRQLSNFDKTYNFLDEETQNAIDAQYWSFINTASAISSIAINDTTLIDNGVAAATYTEADKITVRKLITLDKIHDSTPNGLYQDNTENAWLYQMSKTDIPIRRGRNYINWPIERYEEGANVLFNVASNQCDPVSLDSIQTNALIGSRAGYDLFDSDIIYKLNARNGYPVECAYLKGQLLAGYGDTTFTANMTGCFQSAFTLNCKAGEYTTFIWQGLAGAYADDYIKHVPHQPDCQYLYYPHASLFKENPDDQKSTVDYKQWQKCTCKAINYSPLGHPSENYEDYKEMADIIFLDTLYPLPFSKDQWVGLDGEPYYNSEDFAWFKLTGSTVEPDVGWGEGLWINGQGNPFQFKAGQQYKYLRAGLGHSTTFLTDGTVPYLIIKRDYNLSIAHKPIWYKAIADENGNWQATSDISDMILNPSDYLLYDHIDSNWYCITSIGDYGESVTYKTSALNLTNNPWVNYTWTTSGERVKLLWPSTMTSNAPSALSFQISSVIWGITPPNASIAYYRKNIDEAMEIYTDRIGSWTVSVTGYPFSNAGIAIQQIPNVGDFYVSQALATTTMTGSNAIYTIYADTINMSFNTQLIEAKPYWAYASDTDDYVTKAKGVSKWGGMTTVVDDYTLITQPSASMITLDIDTYIEYTAISPFTWYQPLEFLINDDIKTWCKLYIDTTRMSTLSDFMYNSKIEMIISASNEPSDIVLLPYVETNPMFINYWATSAFTWSQTFTNSAVSVYTPHVTGSLFSVNEPYVNLINRHYPTYATVAHVENLYSTSDSGGYFTPRSLGSSTYLSRNLTNIIDTSTMPTSAGRSLSGIYNDTNKYLTDVGLTNNDQVKMISGVSVDSSWMKSPITQGYGAGSIINSDSYQEFMPYQTKYETCKQNNIGFKMQGDNYDPWYGDMDDVWRDPVDWPPDFRKIYNVSEWYQQLDYNNKQVYQWKIDIFGNQYLLLKDITNKSIYQKRDTLGELWVKKSINNITPASASLSSLYSNIDYYVTQYPTITSEIIEVKDIDVWYDTLMIKTENYLITNKISFSYDTGDISFNFDDMHVISLSTGRFAGTWLFDKTKEVTIATVLSSDVLRPTLYKLDLDTNNLEYIYNRTDDCMGDLTSVRLSSFEEPLLTYNKDTLTYNIGFIARSSFAPYRHGILLNNIYISKYGDVHEITKLSTITPTY